MCHKSFTKSSERRQTKKALLLLTFLSIPLESSSPLCHTVQPTTRAALITIIKIIYNFITWKLLRQEWARRRMKNDGGRSSSREKTHKISERFIGRTKKHRIASEEQNDDGRRWTLTAELWCERAQRSRKRTRREKRVKLSRVLCCCCLAMKHKIIIKKKVHSHSLHCECAAAKLDGKNWPFPRPARRCRCPVHGHHCVEKWRWFALIMRKHWLKSFLLRFHVGRNKKEAEAKNDTRWRRKKNSAKMTILHFCSNNNSLKIV